MGQLTLKALRFDATHGYYEHERRDGNSFEVDVIFDADFSKAGTSDNLENTINYEDVCRFVADVMHGTSQKLIETLAKLIGDKLFERYKNVNRIVVNVRKLSPPLDINCSYSEISLTWQR